MKERKLTYRFHDPNPETATLDHLLKILIEANTEKVQSAIQEAAKTAEKIEPECFYSAR